MSSPALSAPARLPRNSILRRSVAAVLLIELVAAFLLIAATAVHERRARFRALDATLHGRASALLGAVADADDPADNVVLDMTGIDVPRGDVFEVTEANDRVLGHSAEWPLTPERGRNLLRQGDAEIAVGGRRYRFVGLRGVRVVDPGEAGGGKLHRVLVLYGAPTEHVREEVWEAVRYYASTFAVVMLLTALLLVWFLRRALSPIDELAVAAAKISTQAWQFHAPESARATRELAPLAAGIEASVGRLQQSFEQQRRFTSDAAHELKTDVAIIKSSLQLLTMRPRSVDEYRQGLAVGLGDCDRLEATVGEMLTLARVEHADVSREAAGRQSSDLDWHAQEAMRYLAPMAQLRGVGLLQSRTDSGPVALSGRDSDLLCINLLQNALQHSPAGGSVSVAVVASAGVVSMRVQDKGAGIAPHLLAHVFEPFYRAEDARDRKHGGTGLGLAICRAICEKAGGSIHLESRIGNGTLVTVRLPARS